MKSKPNWKSLRRGEGADENIRAKASNEKEILKTRADRESNELILKARERQRSRKYMRISVQMWLSNLPMLT